MFFQVDIVIVVSDHYVHTIERDNFLSQNVCDNAFYFYKNIFKPVIFTKFATDDLPFSQCSSENGQWHAIMTL